MIKAGSGQEALDTLRELKIRNEPVALFVSYGEWDPEYTSVADPDDPAINYAVEQLNRITIGGRYVLDDFLQIKLEYLSHMDTATEEPDFEKRKLTFQLVASF